MDWSQLGPSEASEFIAAVADENEPVIFNPALCEAHRAQVPFYDGYDLVRIVNRHMIPYLLLDYLSNGEDHYYMDGSENPFHALNARGAVSLDESNVIDYLDLYISYVYERGNSFSFVKDREGRSDAKLEGRDGENYRVSVSLNYQDGIVQGRIAIDPKGGIHIREPIAVSFLDELKPRDARSYRHPHETDILEQSRALLSSSDTGRRLLTAGREAGAEGRVLASPNYHGFVTGGRVIYLIMPAAERTATYLQALILAGALRDAEQIAAGYTRPPPDIDESIYTTVNYGKNLDALIEMCKIVEEFGSRDIPEPRHEIGKLGLARVYETYKINKDPEVLMNSYIAALEENGWIKGEAP